MKKASTAVVQLLGLYFAVFHVAPLVESWAPFLGPIGARIVSVILTAIITDVLATLIFARPEIEIVWQDRSSPNALSSLSAKWSKLEQGKIAFTFAVNLRANSPLGALLIMRLRHRRFSLRVESPAAPVYWSVDLCTPARESGKVVSETPEMYGVSVDLCGPERGNPRAWAKVKLQPLSPDAEVINTPFDLVHTIHASTTLATLCAKVVSRRPSADSLTLHR